MRDDRVLRIYTDGGCSGNQNENNVGGWGAILEFGLGGGAATKELYGGEKNTTNNRMEMTALIEAFGAIKKDGQNIQVFSDSSYLIECFRQKWYANWQKNGWKTSQKKPVENKELWLELLPYLEKHKIEFYRVKGHVNLESPRANVEKLYADFCKWNGDVFSVDEFKYVVDKNNRADELAGIGIDENR